MRDHPTPDDLGRLLGLEGDLPHLEEALTHPSFANEQRGPRRVDNQRLEFLGDAVLGLCVTELLMDRFPDAREGELSLMRASLVSADALAAWARGVGLGALLRLGRGADVAGERDQTNVLADAAEAIVAAVYLDLGIDSARALSRRVVEAPLGRLVSGALTGRDPKSLLQERVQARGRPSPRYRVIEAEGPDHDRVFLVVAEVGDEVIGQGRGRSKKLAEQAAARAALEGFEATPPGMTSGTPCPSPGPPAKADAADPMTQESGDPPVRNR